jgi:cell division septal protein FtsQ
MRSIDTAKWNLETEFFRARNNDLVSHEKRIQSIQIHSLHVLLMLALLGLLGFGTYRAGAFLLTWNKLEITSFRLVNPPAYGTETVKRVLARYRTNILALNVDRLQQELELLPEVRAITVTRQIPGTVEIVFETRKPRVQLCERGAYQVYDSDGRLLHCASQPETGLLNVVRTLPGDIPKLMALLPEMTRLGPERIESAAYAAPYGLELKLTGIPEAIYPGECRLREKIEQYLRVRANPKINASSVVHADLRIDDRMYLAYREEV